MSTRKDSQELELTATTTCSVVATNSPPKGIMSPSSCCEELEDEILVMNISLCFKISYFGFDLWCKR